MKKTFALVLLLVLTVGVLAACNQVSTTEKKIRWDESETWTYNISLIDLNSSLSTTDGTYYRDFLASGETDPRNGEVDRIMPEDLSGQYVMTLTKDVTADTTTVSATQTMLATYPVSNLDLEKFVNLIVEQNNEFVTLTSTTETSVTFKNGTQIPTSSYTKVNGFYIGKQNQSLTNYELTTTYEVSNKKVVAKITNGNETEEVSISGTSVIDNNQVLMYVRSFDKTSEGFQDSPQTLVFDPLTKTTKTLSFAYTYSQNVLVNHTFDGATESAQVATTLNRLDVKLGGLSFMTQVNLPDLTDQRLDKINIGGLTSIPKHTIYRFRVGFVTYELTNYLTDDIARAIQVKAE